MKHLPLLTSLAVVAVLAACSPAPTPTAETKTEAPAAAAQVAPAKPTVSDAWIAATGAGVKVTAGYLTIANPGTSDDRLVSVSTTAAGKTELHVMENEAGVMKMRVAEGGVPVPAGGSVTLAPGGTHLMMFDVAAELKDGATVPVTLTFEKAGVVEATFPVKPRTVAGGDKAHSGH